MAREWEYREFLIPLHLTCTAHADQAAQDLLLQRYDEIVITYLEAIAEGGWSHDGPIDPEAMWDARRLKRSEDGDTFTFETVTIRAKRPVPSVGHAAGVEAGSAEHRPTERSRQSDKPVRGQQESGGMAARSQREEAELDQEGLLALNEQANTLADQGNWSDAIALYEMAVEQSSGAVRRRARGALALTLVEMSEAYRGTPGFPSLAHSNYVRVKQEVEKNLRENPSSWADQIAAVAAAQKLAFRWTGPTGFTAWLATGGGSQQMAKESVESYRRLANELLILTKLGQQTLTQKGAVEDWEFVGAGQVALDAMSVFDGDGEQAPLWVLDFFLGIPDDKIVYSGDPDTGPSQVANVKRLAQARKMRR